jgi:hypothetical protein
MKKLLTPFLIMIVICSFSASSFAGFAIQLKNGRILTTPKVWEENGTMNFYWEGGIVSFPKESIVSINEVKDTPSMKNSAAKQANIKINDPGMEAPTPFLPQDRKPEQQKSVKEVAAPEKEKLEGEAFLKEKAIYTEKFEEAHKRYLDACSRRDEEGKKKAWQELTNYAGQVADIKEELKKREAMKKDQEQKEKQP